jgi:SepF-like predicted cell division protein (DUF552 family)
MKTEQHHSIPKKAYLILCTIMTYNSLFAQMKFGYAGNAGMAERKYLDRNDKEIDNGY